MNKKLIKKATEETDNAGSDEDDVTENLEKTKQLMNYAQKQQQAKESHRPGAKFVDIIVDSYFELYQFILMIMIIIR